MVKVPEHAEDVEHIKLLSDVEVYIFADDAFEKFILKSVSRKPVVEVDKR